MASPAIKYNTSCFRLPCRIAGVRCAYKQLAERAQWPRQDGGQVNLGLQCSAGRHRVPLSLYLGPRSVNAVSLRKRPNSLYLQHKLSPYPGALQHLSPLHLKKDEESRIAHRRITSSSARLRARPTRIPAHAQPPPFEAPGPPAMPASTFWGYILLGGAFTTGVTDFFILPVPCALSHTTS
jgi:hypothetical protein